MPPQPAEPNDIPSAPQNRFYIVGRIIASCCLLFACSCSCFALMMGWSFGSTPADEVFQLPDGTPLVVTAAYPVVLLMLTMSIGVVLVLMAIGGSSWHLFGQKHIPRHLGWRSISLLLTIIGLLFLSYALCNGTFGMFQIVMPQLPDFERFFRETSTADTLQGSVLITTICMAASMIIGGLGIGIWFLFVQRKLPQYSQETVQLPHPIKNVQTEIQQNPHITLPDPWPQPANTSWTYKEIFIFLSEKDLHSLDELERGKVFMRILGILSQITPEEKSALIILLYYKGLLTGENVLDLTGTNLRGIQLIDMDLSSINLNGADLESASFHNSRLQQAVFKSANLHKADFRFTNLQAANFQNAILSGAKFHKASLQNADFRMAQVTETNFWSANLTNAKITEQQIEEAKKKDAILP